MRYMSRFREEFRRLHRRYLLQCSRLCVSRRQAFELEVFSGEQFKAQRQTLPFCKVAFRNALNKTSKIPVYAVFVRLHIIAAEQSNRFRTNLIL
jgi:hypothetical protein